MKWKLILNNKKNQTCGVKSASHFCWRGDNLSGNLRVSKAKIWHGSRVWQAWQRGCRKAISKVLGGSPEHLGGSYDKCNVRDSKDRKWSIVYDSSIRCVDKSGCSGIEKLCCWACHPVLEYEDMPLLQEVVRAVRKAGGVTGAGIGQGIHVHIDGAPYTAQSLRNLVNIFASKENFLLICFRCRRCVKLTVKSEQRFPWKAE